MSFNRNSSVENLYNEAELTTEFVQRKIMNEFHCFCKKIIRFLINLDVRKNLSKKLRIYAYGPYGMEERITCARFFKNWSKNSTTFLLEFAAPGDPCQGCMRTIGRLSVGYLKTALSETLKAQFSLKT